MNDRPRKSSFRPARPHGTDGSSRPCSAPPNPVASGSCDVNDGQACLFTQRLGERTLTRSGLADNHDTLHWEPSRARAWPRVRGFAMPGLASFAARKKAADASQSNVNTPLATRALRPRSGSVAVTGAVAIAVANRACMIATPSIVRAIPSARNQAANAPTSAAIIDQEPADARPVVADDRRPHREEGRHGRNRDAPAICAASAPLFGQYSRSRHCGPIMLRGGSAVMSVK